MSGLDGLSDLSRRRFLGAAAVGAGGLAASGLLSGCGPGSGGVVASTGTEPVATGPKRRGGTFRLGLSDSTTNETLDVVGGDFSDSTQVYTHALYDTLTILDPKAPTAALGLAEFLEPAPDLSYWDVRLRSGVEFHNGKTMDADDIITSLQRVLNPKSPGTAAGNIASVDPNRLKKLDSRTVRINLKYPDCSLPDGVAQPANGIVPADYDAKKPVGSGPFYVNTFTPGGRSSFLRNPNYWQEGRPYIDELVTQGFADPGATRANALVSGQLDGAEHIAYSLVPQVEAHPGLQVLVSNSASFITWEMRCDIPPFNDVRVRTAMKLIADRNQIIDVAYSGSRFGYVGNDLPSIQDPVYDHSIPQRRQDIEQAKSLLKQAGQSDLRVSLVVTAGLGPGVVETAQVLAQQAKQAGVTITVDTIPDAATYFSKHYFSAPFKFDFYNTVDFWGYAGFCLYPYPKSPYNLTNWKDPEFDKLVVQARGTADAQKRKEIAAVAQQRLFAAGSQAIYNYWRAADAYSTKFTGFQTDAWGNGLSALRYSNIWLA